MKLGAIFGSSTTAIGATAGAVVVVVGGVVGYSLLREDPVAPDSTPARVVEPAPEAPATPAIPAEERAAPEVVADAPAPQDPAPVTPEPTGPEPPRFDQVRVAPNGNTVVAGRAPAGAEIELRLDGAALAVTRADQGGGFASILMLPPSEMPRILTLAARIDGVEILGEEQVIIAPFAAPEAVAMAEAATAPDPEPQPEPEPAPVDPAAPAATVPEPEPDAQPAPTVASAPEPEVAPTDPTRPAPTIVAETPDATSAAPAEPASAALSDAPAPLAAPMAAAPGRAEPAPPSAPSVIIAGPQGVRVSRGPTQAPSVQTEVQLDAISYDTEGAVILSGRGAGVGQVQVYLNNQPIQLGEIGAGGDWSLSLPDVDPGTYTLRVAELSPAGEITSEVETPFLREDPVRVAEAPTADAGVSVITVQPGFTLWGIAEDTFGEGLAYVQIFEENRDQIRDPNWIFPGQIFRLPEAPEMPGAEPGAVDTDEDG